MLGEEFPRWAREISRFLGIKSQFVLWGNIYDVFPFPLADGTHAMYPLPQYIMKILTEREGYDRIIQYDRTDGFEVLSGRKEDVAGLLGETWEGPRLLIPLGRAAEHIERILKDQSAHTAIFLSFASRYTQDPTRLGDMDELPFFSRLQKLCYEVKPFVLQGKDATPRMNTIIWFSEKLNDLPPFLTVDNPRLKVIGIPKPDSEIRSLIVEELSRGFPEVGALPLEERKRYIGIFIDQTERLFARDIVAVAQFMHRENIPFSRVADAIRGYKLGIVENRWAKIPREKLDRVVEELEKRVKGQRQAVLAAADVIKRAWLGLSGAQHAQVSSRPKGVLFFAGPTGVGKTELAKAITEFLFGSEQNYIRFDMSEFSQEHSDQRLIGAPPGYVGYEVGGELTNAVRQNPFSVILFDEIEKAHPRILDKFLQILEDGRLTDGRGETAYFSETLIIFTSNLGVYTEDASGRKIPLVSPQAPYEEVREKILAAIEKFFKFDIGRPEILNRIGENVIVFDFIRPESARQIFDKMIGNILLRLREERHIVLEILPEVYEKLCALCTEDLSMGGRGIGNRIEKMFVNPLSRALFDAGILEGNAVVTGFTGEGSLYTVSVERKSL